MDPIECTPPSVTVATLAHSLIFVAKNAPTLAKNAPTQCAARAAPENLDTESTNDTLAKSASELPSELPLPQESTNTGPLNHWLSSVENKAKNAPVAAKKGSGGWFDSTRAGREEEKRANSVLKDAKREAVLRCFEELTEELHRNKREIGKWRCVTSELVLQRLRDRGLTSSRRSVSRILAAGKKRELVRRKPQPVSPSEVEEEIWTPQYSQDYNRAKNLQQFYCFSPCSHTQAVGTQHS